MPRILAPDAWPTTIEERSRGQPRRRLINRAGAPQHPELRLQVTPATTDRPKELGRARIAIPHPEPGAELSVLVKVTGVFNGTRLATENWASDSPLAPFPNSGGHGTMREGNNVISSADELVHDRRILRA